MPNDPSYRLPTTFKPTVNAVRAHVKEGQREEKEIEKGKGGEIDVPKGFKVRFPPGALKHERAKYFFGHPAGDYDVVQLSRIVNGERQPDSFDKPVTVRMSLEECDNPDELENLVVYKVKWETGETIAGPIPTRRNGNAKWVEFDLDDFSAYVIVQP